MPRRALNLLPIVPLLQPASRGSSYWGVSSTRLTKVGVTISGLVVAVNRRRSGTRC